MAGFGKMKIMVAAATKLVKMAVNAMVSAGVRCICFAFSIVAAILSYKC